MNYSTEKWLVVELTFNTTKKYDGVDAFYVIMDAEFVNRETKKTYNIPCFWDGDSTFKARFAPTELGTWDYVTKCDTDESLNGITGTVECTEYTGDLELYKHGFIKSVLGTKYFVYDDGTPFFYLGDTHWNMFTEEFDSAGDHAVGIETDSHFKYIVDKRIAQGFNVYQSEPLGGFHLDAGFNETSLEEFQHADKYFKYLADKGITHANAQFFFCTRLTEEFFNDGDKLEILARYWCARYAAYPVMWTLAQECDNDMYDENHPGQKTWWNYANNPWVTVAEFMHKHDAYNRPLSGHQESAIWTTVTGEGAYYPKKSNGGRSVFADDDVSEKCGHDWWATQWKHPVYRLPHALSAKEYWNSSKVAINYEDFYAGFWTNDFGARSRAWLSILSGLFGYGYGATDVWLYKGSFEMDRDANRMDGYSVVTKEEKNIPWSQSVELPSAYQVGYMKQFFESFEWWNLVPDFDNKVSFTPEEDTTLYACATIKNDLYVIYLFSTDKTSGIVGNMADAEYTLQWYNTRTNEYMDAVTIKPNTTDANGAPAYKLEERPDENDWIALIKKI